jgi:hypothetical protein
MYNTVINKVNFIALLSKLVDHCECPYYNHDTDQCSYDWDVYRPCEDRIYEYYISHGIITKNEV